jgi:hypothetical protein
MAGNSSENRTKLIVAWLYVGIPLIWGVIETGTKAMQLFH